VFDYDSDGGEAVTARGAGGRRRRIQEESLEFGVAVLEREDASCGSGKAGE